MKLKIVSPTKVLYEGEAKEVTVPTETGIIGILENHENIVATVSVGEVIINNGSEKKTIIANGGFVRVTNNSIMLLLDDASLSDELVKEKIEEAILLAKQKLGEKLPASELIKLEKQLRYQYLKKKYTDL